MSVLYTYYMCRLDGIYDVLYMASQFASGHITHFFKAAAALFVLYFESRRWSLLSSKHAVRSQLVCVTTEAYNLFANSLSLHLSSKIVTDWHFAWSHSRIAQMYIFFNAIPFFYLSLLLPNHNFMLSLHRINLLMVWSTNMPTTYHWFTVIPII